MKRSWNLPSNFPDPEKVWKIEIKSGRMLKSLEFFFSKLQQVLYKVVFVLVKSYSISPVCLQRPTQKALFRHFSPIWKSWVWKKKLLFGKTSWILDPKICMNPVSVKALLGKSHHLLSNLFPIFTHPIKKPKHNMYVFDYPCHISEDSSLQGGCPCRNYEQLRAI